MFNLISKQAVKQFGGVSQTSSWGAFFAVFLISMIILAIKVLLVHWSYNEIVPTLFNEKYRQITVVEALYLVILIQVLFN